MEENKRSIDSIEELIERMPVANAVLYNVTTKEQVKHLRELVKEKNNCKDNSKDNSKDNTQDNTQEKNKKFHVWRPYGSEYINVARLV